MISNESVKWKEAQEKIYESSKEVTKEEKYSKLGALYLTRQIQMKYLAIKNRVQVNFYVVLELAVIRPFFLTSGRTVF